MHRLGGVKSESNGTIYLYGYEEEPVWCPRCGARTVFQDLDAVGLGMPEQNYLQLHICLNDSCRFVFLAAEA